MKKITLLFALIVVSCKTTKTESTTKFGHELELSHDWLLKKVSHDEPKVFDKIILFNDVTNRCFEQSLWRFNPTNKLGTYSINDMYCSYGKRNISFKILKTDKKTGFSYLVLNSENKAGNAKKHHVRITTFSKTTMQWDYVVYKNNKRYMINMEFERI